MAEFVAGSLVRARGREWVVLPPGDDRDVLLLRPLGGSDAEIAGVFVGDRGDGQPYERVEPAVFLPPDPEKDLGNYWSSLLLRDAARLGVRAGAGPFRCLSKISVEPRPYQLVPLVMALRQDPVRLLIADDVGVGKTIEAALIARELWDRGEVRSVGVLCPPHLAEQWHRALDGMFHMDPVLVLASTAPSLERHIGSRSLFEEHPVVVVSTDFIKQERRREEFLRTAPDLVIVDEAHGCADTGGRGTGQQRHELVMALAKNPDRHMILVTATPHSGIEGAFRSLLGVLDPALAELPLDLSGEQNRSHRERLAKHVIQRRRENVREFLEDKTVFPDRETKDVTYALDKEYRALLEDVLAWSRERVFEAGIGQHKQRVRWWSALSMLRSLSSSPRALEATASARGGFALAADAAAADVLGRAAVGDELDDDAQPEGADTTSGTDIDVADSNVSEDERAALRRFAERARAASGRKDPKLQALIKHVKKQLDEAYAPIVFCRFISTAEYVRDELRRALKDVDVEAVTGLLPPTAREEAIEKLSLSPKRVLVCTDCLAEGINLQSAFDAVVHYDLAWNPTRHEQREGRVDRFGQKRPIVRASTVFGSDNPVDGAVLDVLRRKAQEIHSTMGVVVPMPDSGALVEQAILEAVLLKQHSSATPEAKQLLFAFEETARESEWRDAVERSKRSRAIFAQNPLHELVFKELRDELAQVRKALGSQDDVRRFVREAAQRLSVAVRGDDPIELQFASDRASLVDAVGREGKVCLAFAEDKVTADAPRATRAHPVVAGLAGYVLGRALDGADPRGARRCSVSFHGEITRKTTALLLRVRMHLYGRDRRKREQALHAEEIVVVAFEGNADDPEWLDATRAEALLSLVPQREPTPDQARRRIGDVLRGLPSLALALDRIADERAKALLSAHSRVRTKRDARTRDDAERVEAHRPCDVLGVFLLLPSD